MDRSIRNNGIAKQKVIGLLTIIFIFFISLFLVGFNHSASYIYASEQNDKESSFNENIQGVFNVVQNQSYSVFPPKIIDVKTVNGVSRHLVYSDTVAKTLKEAGVELDENDLTIPDLNKVITHMSAIQIIDVEIEYIVKKEVVPYKSIEKKTEDLNTGTYKVSQDGVNGEIERTIKVMYHDGIAVSSSVVKTDTIVNTVDKIILVGTKSVTIQSCGYWDNVIDRFVDPASNKRKNDWMKFVMRCETWCDSGQNTRNTYFGLYQFNRNTFRAYSGGKDIWDGTEQIKVVSSMYDTPGNRGWHWPSCNAKFNNL